ncbi:MAG: homoserine O-acetyltransferase [Crocinitomicaceae bacterium]|nr:homoserine O-acetyltransferase [Crocinitomicaceae bacterium]
MATYNYFIHPHGLALESGEKLDELRIAYTIFGNPQARKTVWVCHALSGNSLVAEWWSGLFGENRFFNFSEYRIVCANVIGSCYGSTGPEDLADNEGFPLITIKDIVKAHILLRRYLKIEEIDILIGASLGGQQAVEWAIEESDRIKELILIATNADHSPWGKAANEAQRLALLADSSFGKKGGGKEGLKAARAIAMLSYRSYDDFTIKQSETVAKPDDYRACSYVRYQGEKFIDRFSARSYYTLTKAMDSHNVGRGRDTIKSALQSIKARTLVVGVDSDTLFPLCEQEFLADYIPNAELGVIHSKHGHDAFLIEYEQLQKLLDEFIYNDFKGFKPTIFKTLTQ